jgi:Protein of unknown function (DUF2752)
MSPMPRSAPRAARHALIGPVATAGAAIAGLVTIGLVDPAQGGTYLRCPLNALTGHWCPGCGMTRATHQFVTGHPLAALGSNLLWPLFAALLVGAWFSWYRTAQQRPLPRWPLQLSPRTWVVLGMALVVFTVLRNLPADPFSALAP